MDVYQEMGTPSAAHKLLARMAGSWNVTSSCLMEPGGQPIESTASSEHKMVLDGRFLQQEYNGDMQLQRSCPRPCNLAFGDQFRGRQLLPLRDVFHRHGWQRRADGGDDLQAERVKKKYFSVAWLFVIAGMKGVYRLTPFFCASGIAMSSGAEVQLHG